MSIAFAAVPFIMLGLSAVAIPCESRRPAADNASIPEPVRRQVEKELEPVYRVVAHLNPFYLRGDLNGDGRSDYILLVEEKASCKIGLAAFLSARTGYSLQILGAGRPFRFASSSGDDFSFIDSWQIYDKRVVGQGATNAAPPRLQGDALLIEKKESASGLIFWRGQTFRWYQQGD